MDVSVDKAWHGDHAAAVDFVYGPAAKVWPNRNDLAAIKEKVARLDDPKRGIHRHDRGALHAYSRQHEQYPRCMSVSAAQSHGRDICDCQLSIVGLFADRHFAPGQANFGKSRGVDTKRLTHVGHDSHDFADEIAICVLDSF